MLQQKINQNKERLGIADLEVDLKHTYKQNADKIKSNVKNIPQVYYYNVELVPQYIKKVIVDSNRFMPTCYVCFIDGYGLMHDVGFPTDNAKLTVCIPSTSESLGGIFMEFKITKFHVESDKKTDVKKIHMWGVCAVDRLLISEYKSYPTKTSYQLFQDFCNETGMGLVSNVDSSSDEMSWINPNFSNNLFIQDVTNKAWINESSFVWSFVDLYYNLNYVNVEAALTQDISEITWFNSNLLNNTAVNSNPSRDQTIKPFLTNDNSQMTSNSYFYGKKVLNNSTEMSLKNGYIRNIHFYDIDGNWEEKAGSYKKYALDTITTEGTNSPVILLKGDPGNTDFYNLNSKNIYVDKLDTTNMHPDYLWAKMQNSENLKDLQKVGMSIVVPYPNFNIKRFEKLELLFLNKDEGNVMKSAGKKAKLSGEWLVIGQRFIWSDSALHQELRLVKRELNAT